MLRQNLGYNTLSITLISLILIVSFNCSQSQQILNLAEIDDNILVEIPVELVPGTIQSEANTLKGVSTDNGDAPLLFQRIPSLIYVNDTLPKQTYCALITKQSPSGKLTLAKIDAKSAFAFAEKEPGKLYIMENETP